MHTGCLQTGQSETCHKIVGGTPLTLTQIKVQTAGCLEGIGEQILDGRNGAPAD